MGADRKKAGRKVEYDWSRVELETHRLMDINGEFDNSKPTWSVQARLEDALLVFCAIEFSREPSPAALRRQLPVWLASWHRQRRCAAE